VNHAFNTSSKASIDHQSIGAGNSPMTGISMSGLSKQIVRQSSKSSFKDQERGSNSNLNAAYA
jgi:hypothetical protein